MADDIILPQGNSQGETFVPPIGLFDVDGHPVSTAAELRAYVGGLFAEFMAMYPDDPITRDHADSLYAPIDSHGGTGAVSKVDGRVGDVTLTDLYDPAGAAAAAQANATAAIGTQVMAAFNAAISDTVNKVAAEAVARDLAIAAAKAQAVGDATAAASSTSAGQVAAEAVRATAAEAALASSDWSAADSGFAAWTFDPLGQATMAFAAIPAGKAYVMAVKAAKAGPITKAWLPINTKGATPGTTVIGILDNAGSPVADTGLIDFTSSTPANMVNVQQAGKSFAVGELLYIVIVNVGGSTLSLLRLTNGAAAATANYRNPSTLTPRMWSVASAGMISSLAGIAPSQIAYFCAVL